MYAALFSARYLFLARAFWLISMGKKLAFCEPSHNFLQRKHSDHAMLWVTLAQEPQNRQINDITLAHFHTART